MFARGDEPGRRAWRHVRWLRNAHCTRRRGGIREPLIVKWPNVVPAGARSSVPVISIDFLPTLCEAAGVDLADLPVTESLDGKSLVPTLKGEVTDLAHRTLYWHYPHFSSMGGRPSGAIRSGRWKLIEHFEANTIELFDLVNDIGETRDVLAIHPEQARKLRQQLSAWRKSLDAGMPQRPNPKYQADK